ncbi:inorganic phosphate transporter [Planosporangium thailandense]|uniref:Phosphate transporter n=1 Tax=Planosporangium thailandense TaxID=765197 RepID=A0ABX0Y3J6_9ACTN|nr:inorganic phosphate transporter [Planosporangium thailandense]NJC72008.1 inorganic phosphate transporter [Planosporangium thailandense]
MGVATLSLIGLIGLAVLFDYTNGFHDAANSIATVVATRVLRPRWAVAWAALFNFVAFLVVGTAVANTVGQTVKSEYFGMAVVFAALLGAICWNYLSWHLGLPTSSSHALIGGLVGAGLVRGGPDAIKAASVQKAALFIVISPLAGLLLAGLIMVVLRLVFARADVARTERGFRWAQLASSAAVSLGHGGNDAQKTMGVVAALLVSTGHLHATGDKLPIPLWVMLLAEAAIAAGTLSGGWRIVRTMGMRITRLRPVSGFAAETGAAMALFTSTAMGAPVSTTHTVAGAITGVGLTNRGTSANWSVFGRVAVAWLVTMPTAAALAAGAYWLVTGPPRPLNLVLTAAVLVPLLVLLVRAVRRAPTAADVDPGTRAVAVPLRPGAGSVIDTGLVPENDEVRMPRQRVAPERPDLRAGRSVGEPL